jgi:hypothetical protein
MAEVVTWLHRAVLALIKLVLTFSALVFIRGLAWLVNTFILLPLSDPLRVLPGHDGKLFQSHFNEVMKYVDYL